MTRMFAAVGESVLRRVVPEAKAEAWWGTDCWCSGAGDQWVEWCYWKGSNQVICHCTLYCTVCCV